MPEKLSVLCYLTSEQMSSPVNLGQLAPFAGEGNAKLVGNAFNASLDPEEEKAQGDRLIRSLLEKNGQVWEAETIWEPSGKDWIANAQAAHDLVVLFGQRNKAKYSLPVDWSLLQVIEKPFLVINPGQKRRKRNKVLAAIDVANKKQQQLNEYILMSAAKMAEIFEAALHIITVVEISQVAADLDLVDPVKQEAGFRGKHKQQLEELAAQFGAAIENVHVETGVPAEVIRKTAKKLDVVLTAVGTERRSGLSGLLFGNTVDVVLGQSPNNVLVVPRLA